MQRAPMKNFQVLSSRVYTVDGPKAATQTITYPILNVTNSFLKYLIENTVTPTDLHTKSIDLVIGEASATLIPLDATESNSSPLRSAHGAIQPFAQLLMARFDALLEWFVGNVSLSSSLEQLLL